LTPLQRVLDSLARRASTDLPVAIVAAHPDDETIGAGASLGLFRNLVLIHVTDGAPRAGPDAVAAGFVDGRAYAAARRRELHAALDIAEAFPVLMELGAADQGASLLMPALAEALAALWRRHGTQVAITHPYEGGHPDHDATAFATHATGIAVLEMASYHAGPDGIETGVFLPNGPAPLVVTLDAAEQARKRAMLGCFMTQHATLAPFGCTHETFRPAPAYAFDRPPHDGILHYERHDWGMTGAEWRMLAAA